MTWRDVLRRQRITRSGAAYVLAIVLVAFAAFISANNLLFLILAALVSAFLISGFVGRMGLAELELDLLLPQHTSARQAVRAAVRVRNLKTHVPSFSVNLAFSREPGGAIQPVLYFPVIPGGATIEEPAELYFPHRGAHTQREFQFSTRFPFGFVERREDVTIRHEVIVYPCLQPRPGLDDLVQSVGAEAAIQQRGQGTDFYRIRPYQGSESARHVDWKATAHTGSMQVREFARQEDFAISIHFDQRAPAGEWFEAAVECAAYLAFEFAQRGIRVRFISQGFAVTVPDAGDVYTILKYLALVSPHVGRLSAGPDEYHCHVIITHDPQHFYALGWSHESRNVRFIGPELV